MPGVVVYLTFTLMYGGIITHSFSTCKLHLKQSGKVPQPVLTVNYPSKALWEVDNKIFTITITITRGVNNERLNKVSALNLLVYF